jgi:hypothetical protein
MAAIIQVVIFWIVTPCSLVGEYQCPRLHNCSQVVCVLHYLPSVCPFICQNISFILPLITVPFSHCEIDTAHLNTNQLKCCVL